jgi:ABC-type dipeptide/oligopeptide/nickel transport system ATPase subunit
MSRRGPRPHFSPDDVISSSMTPFAPSVIVTVPSRPCDALGWCSPIEVISPGLDFIEVAGSRKHVISYLGDFLFPPERARAKVSSLSGGERNRLLLARLFAQPANVLVLDEPTNDLDIETLELLEALLQDYSGTLFW